MIPVIDLNSNKIFTEVENAFTEIGFAIFVNHFNEKEKQNLNKWQKITKQFFKLPNEIKKKYHFQDSKINVGYDFFKSENVNVNTPADLKESFNFSNNHQMLEKLWPTEVKDFKKVGIELERSAHNLSLRFLSIFEKVLSVQKDFLVSKHVNSLSTLRTIHYPAYKEKIKKDQLRIGEHTDYGTMTILWQLNEVSGLEIMHKNGKWIEIPFIKNSVIVNIGDLLQRWTNDFFKSTAHRVNNSKIDFSRFSMPYFIHPQEGTMIKNLTSNKSKYPPILSDKYLKWRLSQSYKKENFKNLR